MLPASLKNLLRISGISVSAFLAVLPWLITPDSDDPFLFHGWVVYAATAVAICLLSVIFLFFRPRQNQLPYARAFLLLFAVITTTTLLSSFIVSLRTALTWLSLMVLAGFLRLSRQDADNFNIAAMIVLSGFLMAIYGLFQAAGLDVINWASNYSMVGTLSNPNFFTTFLSLTAMVSLGLSMNQSYRHKFTSLIFWCMTAIQILAVMISGRVGSIVTLGFGIFLMTTSFWEVRPGRLLRRSSFISGLLLAIVLTGAYGLVYYATSTYPWQTSAQFYHRDYPVITRIINWQMGYGIFLKNPLLGMGPGTLPFAMPLQRPPTGSTMGLKQYNDDPHSWPVSILAETGFAGLFGFASVLAIVYGCGTWRRFKNQQIDDGRASQAKEDDNLRFVDDNLSWKAVLLIAVAAPVGYLAGLIGPGALIYSFPAAIVIFGLHNLFIGMSADKSRLQPVNLAKTLLVTLLVFAFNGLFNNSFSILPLLAFATLLFSLHFSVCLRNIAWKRRFTFLSLFFVCLPAMYVFTAYNFQIAYHREQVNLSLGERLLAGQNFAESQTAFESAIQANPQSLKAHYGLAMVLEQQNRLDETQDILRKLDSMVPNVFNTNYELARILFERRQIIEAHKYALKSLQWSQSPRIYDLLGRILLMEGKQLEAERIFEEGLLLIPPDAQERLAADRIRLNLAALLAGRGSYDKCQEYLKQIRSELKENIDYIYLQGMVLSRNQKYQEALELFEKGLEKDPQNARLMNAVGYILTLQNTDLERAANLLESAYQNIKRSGSPPQSDFLMIVHSLGNLYWKQGKLAEAREMLEIAWSQCPPDWQKLKSERLENLRQFYRETGMQQELENLQAQEPLPGEPREQH
jgi:tetratricopeptide (TPR) repeat protein